MTASATRDLSSPGASGSAFDLAGGPDAVLLLHGLTGSPFEMGHVARRLHAAGMRCRAPVMAGHGGPPGALAHLPWAAWVDGARRELDLLAGARRLLLVGCSMGALVALALASERPRAVSGIALLAPSLELAGIARVAGALGRWPPLGRRLPPVPKLGGSDVRDPVMRRLNPTMSAVPLAAVGELTALARHVEQVLPGVRAPALVVVGRRDHTTRPAGARRLASRLGARLVVLERSFHLVGIDLERDRCADEVAAFFDTVPVVRDGGQEG